MEAELAPLPDDVDALKAALLAARADVARVTAEAAAALAERSSNLALIAHLKLQIEKLKPRPLRPALRAHRPPAGPDGVATRGARLSVWSGWRTENRIRHGRSKLRYPSDLTDEEWALILLIPRPSAAAIIPGRKFSRSSTA